MNSGTLCCAKMIHSQAKDVTEMSREIPLTDALRASFVAMVLLLAPYTGIAAQQASGQTDLQIQAVGLQALSHVRELGLRIILEGNPASVPARPAGQTAALLQHFGFDTLTANEQAACQSRAVSVSINPWARP